MTCPPLHLIDLPDILTPSPTNLTKDGTEYEPVRPGHDFGILRRKKYHLLLLPRKKYLANRT